MAIEIIRSPKTLGLPLDIDCSNYTCQAGLRLHSLSDIEGTNYDTPYQSLWANCPCCGYFISINSRDLSDAEVKTICETTEVNRNTLKKE